MAICALGTTYENYGCVDCTHGKYKSEPGLEPCISCPAPRTASDTGATSVNDCSCGAGQIALEGDQVQITSLGDFSDESVINCNAACTIAIQPHQRLKSVELTGSGHTHISVTVDGLVTFSCTTDCDLLLGSPFHLHNALGTVQVMVTSGQVTITLFNGRDAVFSSSLSSSTAWLNTVAARTLVARYHLQVGDVLFDSTTTALTQSACSDCVPGLVCDPFIEL